MKQRMKRDIYLFMVYLMALVHAVAWLRHYTTSREVAGSIPDVIGFSNLSNPSSRTMALGSTQPPTEMSTRNLPGGKGRLAHGADNLTAIGEPIV
jgi:hypothetical protein